MKIYVKLSLLVSFLVIASSAALFFLTDNQVETAIRQEILSNLTRQSEQSVENIERFIFSRLNDVKMAATNPYFKNTNTDQEELIARLQELENLNDLYYSFSYFNMDRVRLADSKRQAIGKQHSNSSFWTLVGQDNEAVLDITEDEASNLVMMHFATIVRNGSENVGVLVGSIRVDELYKLMGDLSLSSEGGRRMEVNWVDSQGTLLYSNTNPDDILKSKYEKFDQIKDLNRTGVNFTETDEELIFVTKDSGYLNYEGSNWKLILRITKEQAFSPLSDVRSRFVFAALGALILSLIIAIVVANIFVKPIVRLSKAAEQLGEGKLDTDLTQSFSSDEIGTLAKNLSATTQTLLNKIE